MKQLFSSLFLVLLCSLAFAQLDTAYIYTYGGELDEQGRDIEPTSDNGFIMVGATSSFGNGNSDIYLVKVDSNLQYQWSSAIGHDRLEFGHAVKQTPDGGFVMCGYTNSIGNGTYDGYLVKTNDTGGVVWEQHYGGFDWDKFYDLEITSDGGFILVGETHSAGAGNADAWVIKTDSKGKLEWEKTFGGKGKDIAHALISTKDGNYAFCGENASKNPENKGDAWLVKFDGKGEVGFDICETTLPERDYMKDLVETNDNGFGLVGTSASYNPNTVHILVMKFDKNGKHLWHEPHGSVYHTNKSNDFGEGITEHPSGNLAIIGTSGIGNNGNNVYTAMVSGGNGSYITAPSYGGNKDDSGFDLLINPKGGELFLGTLKSEQTGYTNFGIIQTDTIDGNKQLVFDNYIDSSIEKSITSRINNQESNSFKVIPNPFRERIVLTNLFDITNQQQIKINIMDYKGSIVFSKLLYVVVKDYEINCEALKAGPYLIQIQSQNINKTLRIIKK